MAIGYDLSKDLPEELAITDRSRRFWEGKYEFDDEGFTDEQGVYRAFDGCETESRAPTPLPPIYLMKYMKEIGEGDMEEAMAEAPASGQTASSTSASGGVKTSGRRSRKHDLSTIVHSEESGTSPFSDCPSDLSDRGMSDKTKNSTTKVKDNKAETKVEKPEKAKTKQALKRNTTTRGVAQKVNKSAKAKKEKAPAATPVVLQRQAGRGTARRRSGR